MVKEPRSLLQLPHGATLHIHDRHHHHATLLLSLPVIQDPGVANGSHHRRRACTVPRQSQSLSKASTSHTQKKKTLSSPTVGRPRKHDLRICMGLSRGDFLQQGPLLFEEAVEACFLSLGDNMPRRRPLARARRRQYGPPVSGLDEVPGRRKRNGTRGRILRRRSLEEGSPGVGRLDPLRVRRS